jgi:serine/threonine-protein phosphatase CPPED1
MKTHFTRRDMLRATGSLAAASMLPTWMTANGATEEDDGSFYFFQLADTQFFWGNDPVGRWKSVIAQANRLRPAFVVVCGDLINRNGDAAKVDLKEDERRTRAYLDGAAKLDKTIPLRNVAGNHDVCNVPTPETLRWYERRFGPPWYTFTHKSTQFVVIESDLMKNPQGAAGAAEQQMEWLKRTLSAERPKGVPHRIVFLHHPLALKGLDEPDGYFLLPKKRRAELVSLFRQAGVRTVFSGHYHGNAVVRDGDLEMITTNGLAKALRGDPLGFRIVRVGPEGVEHAFYAHENVPLTLTV